MSTVLETRMRVCSRRFCRNDYGSNVQFSLYVLNQNEMTFAGESCLLLQVQKSLSHVTRDRLHRITIAYPEIIDADWLLNQLAIQHKRSNIEINPITGGAWSINLDRCYELLSKLPWQQGARRLSLDDLVHNRRMSLVGWLECMLPDKKDSDFVSPTITAII